jgi:hypothetical protein
MLPRRKYFSFHLQEAECMTLLLPVALNSIVREAREHLASLDNKSNKIIANQL